MTAPGRAPHTAYADDGADSGSKPITTPPQSEPLDPIRPRKNAGRRPPTPAREPPEPRSDPSAFRTPVTTKPSSLQSQPRRADDHLTTETSSGFDKTVRHSPPSTPPVRSKSPKPISPHSRRPDPVSTKTDRDSGLENDPQPPQSDGNFTPDQPGLPQNKSSSAQNRSPPRVRGPPSTRSVRAKVPTPINPRSGKTDPRSSKSEDPLQPEHPINQISPTTSPRHDRPQPALDFEPNRSRPAPPTRPSSQSPQSIPASLPPTPCSPHDPNSIKTTRPREPETTGPASRRHSECDPHREPPRSNPRNPRTPSPRRRRPSPVP